MRVRSMRQVLTSLILITLLTLSACGFHLRGQLPLPENASVLYVDANATEFRGELIDGLRTAGATIVDEPALAKATLKIKDEYAEREALTVNTDGKATSYKLHYTIDFSIVDAEEKVLKENAVSESRQYSFESGQATLQEREEAELLEEMRKELVLKLIRQLGAI